MLLFTHNQLCFIFRNPTSASSAKIISGIFYSESFRLWIKASAKLNTVRHSKPSMTLCLNSRSQILSVNAIFQRTPFFISQTLRHEQHKIFFQLPPSYSQILRVGVFCLLSPKEAQIKLHSFSTKMCALGCLRRLFLTAYNLPV